MGHAGAIISGGGGKEKRLTGAGISLILTAECAEVRGEKQKRSANLCVLCGYMYHTHHIFQQLLQNPRQYPSPPPASFHVGEVSVHHQS